MESSARGITSMSWRSGRGITSMSWWSLLLATVSAAPSICAAEASRLPKEMRALIAASAAHSTLENVALPKLGDLHRRFTGLPDACEVLVAVHGSSINPADGSSPGPYPQVMGSDLAGTVIAAETKCQRLQVGDEVWGDIGAVVQSGPAKGKENGAFGQVAVALESQLGRKPRNLDFAEAGALPKVALTSYKALRWYGGAPYDTGGRQAVVVVLGGSGGCGTTAIQLARMWGAAEVIATTSAANMQYVADLGATRVIDYRADNWWEVLADGSLDVVYDTVGQSGTGDRAMSKLKPGGSYVTIAGALPTSPRQDVQSHMFINSATNLNSSEWLDTLREAVEADRLRMRAFTTYPLESVKAAFEESRQGHVRGKLAITLPSLGSTGVPVIEEEEEDTSPKPEAEPQAVVL